MQCISTASTSENGSALDVAECRLCISFQQVLHPHIRIGKKAISVEMYALSIHIYCAPSSAVCDIQLFARKATTGVITIWFDHCNVRNLHVGHVENQEQRRVTASKVFMPSRIGVVQLSHLIEHSRQRVSCNGTRHRAHRDEVSTIS